jgi:DNA polymerase
MSADMDTAASPDAVHTLNLDARQRAMLKAMGTPVWWPVAEQVKAVPNATQAAEPAPKFAANNSTNTSAEAVFAHKLAAKPVGSPLVAATLPASAPAAIRPTVDDMDWTELTEAINTCQACGLCKGRQRAVPGSGDTQATWMIVGEAPGEQEDREGLPFVGPAGQLLDAMLAAMGLQRDQGVYIANVIKCRPPHNRNPEPAEVAQCQPYLQRQIELVQPKLILALGRFAAQSLLAGVVPDVERLPLGKLRGQVYQMAGRPVVVSYHPAYLLRSPAEKGKAWADLCLAMEHLGVNPLDA